MQWRECACQCRRHRRLVFNPWVGKIPWSRKWQPTPIFLPEKTHGQRSLADYSPWGHKEFDMTLSTQASTHTLTDITKRQQVLLHNYIPTLSFQNTPTKYEGKVSMFENRSQRRWGGETKPPSGPVMWDLLHGAHGGNRDSRETRAEHALRFCSGSWPGEVPLPHVS